MQLLQVLRTNTLVVFKGTEKWKRLLRFEKMLLILGSMDDLGLLSTYEAKPIRKCAAQDIISFAVF